jgi:fatty acid desaturase
MRKPTCLPNMALSGLVLALAAVELVFVPIMLLPANFGGALLAVGIVSAATPLKSALIHEAIHGRLFGSFARNDLLGRTLTITSGVALDVLRFGHLAHHRFNRHPLDRPDIIPEGRGLVLGWAAYYAHLLGGVYVTELSVTVLALLPRRLLEYLLETAFSGTDNATTILLSGAKRAIGNPIRLRRVRFDAGSALAVYSASFYLYGSNWVVLATGLLIHGLIISLQDNAAHYGTPAAIGASAYNTHLPRWLAALLLYQNLHDVHHNRPDLAWTDLPKEFERTGGIYNGGYMRAVLRQLKGPITEPSRES